jgi:hypothetical protein
MLTQRTHSIATASFEAWWKSHFGPTDTKMTYAKTEAILASALASVHADEQDLPYLNAYPEQDISRWDDLRDACHELHVLGADMGIVEQLMFLATENVYDRRAIKMLEYIQGNDNLSKIKLLLETLPSMIDDLKRVKDNPGFAHMSPAFQREMQNLLGAATVELELYRKPFAEAYRRATHDDPLLTILEHDASTRRTNATIARIVPLASEPLETLIGRPSSELATLAMVLLSDHLRECTEKPHYREVGRFAQVLFPDCLAETRRRRTRYTPSAQRLATMVKDRCKAFKKSHDVAALRKTIIGHP